MKKSMLHKAAMLIFAMSFLVACSSPTKQCQSAGWQPNQQVIIYHKNETEFKVADGNGVVYYYPRAGETCTDTQVKSVL